MYTMSNISYKISYCWYKTLNTLLKVTFIFSLVLEFEQIIKHAEVFYFSIIFAIEKSEFSLNIWLWTIFCKVKIT